MAVLLRSISIHGISLETLLEPGNAEWKTVHDLVSNGIRDGTVKPLPTIVFERDDVEAAFRFMAQGKHIGKVLIKVKIPAYYLVISTTLRNGNVNSVFSSHKIS